MLGLLLLLSVTSPNGQEITEIPAQQPFSILLKVNSQEQLGKPSIAGLGQFLLQGTSSTSRFVVRNGTMSAERSFNYSVRAERPGTYIIGPAQLDVGGKSEESNRVKITVTPAAKSDERGPAFLEVTTDKKMVMVGQPVTVTLKLFVKDGVQQAQPMAIDFARHGWTVQNSDPVQSSQRTIHGQVYHVYEQKFMLKSSVPGKKTIPALTVDLVAPVQQQMSLFSLFGRQELVQAHSESIEVTVTDLPQHNGPVHGIGNFTKFEAELVPTTARVGEGMVLKLKALGAGETQHSPELVLPENVTAYESRHHENTFEYVVQGLQPGKYKLPAQQFTFFDQQKNSYKTLKSNPITLTITGAAVEPIKAAPELQEQPQTQSVVAPTTVASSINYKRWLLVVLLALLGFVLVWLFYRKLQSWYRGTQTVQATAFKRAYKQLQYLQKTNNPAGLYQLFITLISERTQTPVGDITEFSIRHKLFELGVAQVQIDELLNFMSEITEIAFARRTIGSDSFSRARHWLDQLRRWL